MEVQQVTDSFNALVQERDRYKAAAVKSEGVASRAIKAADLATAELSKRLTEISTVLGAVIASTTHGGDSIGPLVRMTIVRSHVLGIRESGLDSVAGADEALCRLVDEAGDGDIPELREILLTSGVRIAAAMTDADLVTFKAFIGRSPAAQEKK